MGAKVSAQTYANLERALHDHVMDEADHDPELIRDWVLVAATASMADTGNEADIVVFRAHQTALYAVTGLLEWAKEAYGEVEL
jgi:hypothetical protein